MNEKEFVSILKDNDILILTTQQVKYLWELFRSSGLLIQNQLNFRRYVSIISFYFRNIILNQNYFIKTIKIKSILSKTREELYLSKLDLIDKEFNLKKKIKSHLNLISLSEQNLKYIESFLHSEKKTPKEEEQFMKYYSKRVSLQNILSDCYTNYLFFE